MLYPLSPNFPQIKRKLTKQNLLFLIAVLIPQILHESIISCFYASLLMIGNPFHKASETIRKSLKPINSIDSNSNLNQNCKIDRHRESQTHQGGKREEKKRQSVFNNVIFIILIKNKKRRMLKICFFAFRFDSGPERNFSL